MELLQDKLMTHPPEPWFSSIVSLEILFQLPFFFVAVCALLMSQPNNNMNNKNKNNDSNADRQSMIQGTGYFRSLCIIYGSSTATTLIPIFGCILSDGETSMAEKSILLGFYLPYLIFPLWLVGIAVGNEDMFSSANAKIKEKP